MCWHRFFIWVGGTGCKAFKYGQNACQEIRSKHFLVCFKRNLFGIESELTGSCFQSRAEGEHNVFPDGIYHDDDYRYHEHDIADVENSL